jgi:hypothetical protein
MNTTKQVPDYNHIQNGVTWLGGTTHELQKQHIPGYAGHVKGIYAENVYGKNFARVTAECLNERNAKGIDIDKVPSSLFRIKNIKLTISRNSRESMHGRLNLSQQPNQYWVSLKRNKK